MSKPVPNTDIKRAEFDIHGEPVTDFNQAKKLRPKQIKRNPDQSKHSTLNIDMDLRMETKILS